MRRRELDVGSPIYLIDYDYDNKKHLLESRVLALVSNGYIANAPWTMGGSTFIAQADENETWKHRRETVVRRHAKRRKFSRHRKGGL